MQVTWLILCPLVMDTFAGRFICKKNEDHCTTSLVIDYAFTMIDPNKGPVYAKDRRIYLVENDEEVPTENVITADGWNTTQQLLTVNQSMPGPSIFLYQNQKITIFVHNNLLNEGITIHWHGIDQMGWPAMDGVNFVTQCPILPGQVFNYTFQPRFSGTYWYHSHLGNQRDLGLFGAFIVLKRNEEVNLKHQHIIQVHEWNHMYNAIALLKANVKNAQDSQSILINGRGEFGGNMAPLETYEVDINGEHLFRMIGVGSAATFLFSIPGIPLIVKETDGFSVVETVVDGIIIYPAERYDFELDLSKVQPGMYKMKVEVLEGKQLEKQQNIDGLAFLHVTNKHALLVDSEVGIQKSNTILNCPFETFPKRPDFKCIPLSSLKSTYLSKDFHSDCVSRTSEISTHFLNFGFPSPTRYSSINGHRFVMPTVSALLQPSELDTSCSQCDSETSCECTYALNLNSDAEIIMVLSSVGNGASISHPIHMHGHTYEVLKMGFPTVTETGTLIPNTDILCNPNLPNSQSQCNKAKWRDSAWMDYQNIPGINIHDPVRKDTIVVPYGGYAIIRIWATNPGVWFMHCHIDRHMVGGMAVMLNESFDRITEYIPKGLPTCHSFKNDHTVTASVTGAFTATAESSGPSPLMSALLVLFLGIAALVVILCIWWIMKQIGKGKQKIA